MHDGLSWACSKVKSGGYDRNDIDQTNPAIWGHEPRETHDRDLRDLAKSDGPRQCDWVNDYDRAAEIAGALQARLGEIHFPLNASVEREIQRQVFEYADELKGLGLPPERVIVAVKRVANEAGLHSSRVIPSPRHLEGKDKLLVDMVGWCIERYYGKPPRAE
jgi:hypothetical protein